MRMNVYIPDDLHEEVKAKLGDANISSIVQVALRAEMIRIDGMVRLNEVEFSRVVAFDADEGREFAFKGKKIGSDSGSGKCTMDAYLTPRNAIVVVGAGSQDPDQLLGIHDSYQDFLIYGRYPWVLSASVADSMGEQPPIEFRDL